MAPLRKARQLFSRAKEISRERGILYCLQHTARTTGYWTRLYLELCYYSMFKSRTFRFQGETHRYFYHAYNATWRNERAVEVPIVWSIKQKAQGNILEVGNVLSHYFKVSHDIVDKYEKAVGVINEDVTGFRPNKRYNLIISISTLEHVGLDEEPRETGKIVSAVANLRTLLSEGGKILVTIPLGYNVELDRLVETGQIAFHRLFCLKRVSRHEWKESDWNDVRGTKYGYPFPMANALVIGVIQRDEYCRSNQIRQIREPHAHAGSYVRSCVVNQSKEPSHSTPP